MPTATLQKTKQQGGWALIDIAAKCKTLLLHRMWLQSYKDGTATAAWLKFWHLDGPQKNPPPRDRTLQQFEYLQIYASDMAYIPQPDRAECTQAVKQRIYRTLHTMNRAGTGNREMRIVQQWPGSDWDSIWRNLHNKAIRDTLKATWYRIIPDLIPTKVRLAAISLAETNKCDRCAKVDTTIHRLTDCTPSADIWKWTRTRIAAILRTDQRYIPNDWTTRPQFHLWPPQRHNATVWTLAHLVWYITNEHRLSLTDYIDFLRRARWKAYKRPRQRRIVGNYLEVL